MSTLPSRHNIVAPAPDGQSRLIVNLLSGQADVLSLAEVAAIETGTAEGEAQAKGYVVTPEDEAKKERAAYLDFLDQRETDEVQLFFAPTYACNFACTYCFQSAYPAERGKDAKAVVDAFFAYVDAQFAGRKSYLTLFGGEPLLPSPEQRRTVAALVSGAAARGLDVAVVTNGYHLVDYLDLLGEAHLREIQITLDGVGPLHDRRRPLKGGGATFERVVAGLEATLARGIPVNLRVVVDRENLAGLVDLARFAKDRGWLGHRHFKTQLGRNYELHVCQVEQDRLFSRLGLHEALLALAEKHPEVLELHRPAFGLARRLFDSQELPPPAFDTCPGCKSEWAFDLSGNIYACTATVGKPGESLGTFYPEVRRDEAQIAAWQDRDVLAIPECTGCPVKLACGGGCAALAKNTTGRLHGPDCRPIADLLALGARLYAPKDADEALTG